MRASRTRVAGALGAIGLLVGLATSQAVAGASVPMAAPGPAPIGGAQLGPGLAVNLAPGLKPLPANMTPKAWLVADLDTGQVLGAYDAHVEHRPASTLKTLAALALIPTVDPAAKVAFTTAEYNLTAQKDGRTTRVGLVPGTSYPAKRLFEAMLALSANDATEALAAAAPGGRSATLASMNTIAAALQAGDTHAVTPDGLDGPGQQTSAYDLALIARAAIAQPGFTAYDTVPLVKLPSSGRPLGGSNHDRLQNSYPGVIGGKDGYTTDSGQVWWGAAKKNGHRLVVTEMDAGFEPVTQEIQLLSWGFAVDGKIAPVGTLVPPVSATGAPAAHGGVAAPPVAPVPGAHAAPVARRSAPGSGPWAWLLGVLIVLAAGALAGRHVRAGGPRGKRPTGLGGSPRPAAMELVTSAASAASTATAGAAAASTDGATNPTRSAAEDPAAASPAPPSAGPPRSEVTAAGSLRPWEAPVRDCSVVLRSPATPGWEPDGGESRRGGRDADLPVAMASWPVAMPETARSLAERSQADRLRTGAVRIIETPAPAVPDVDEVAAPQRLF